MHEKALKIGRVQAEERIYWIDQAKVIAIYLVVLGHLLQTTGCEGGLHNFIYLFHMPFFFFVSGYLFKTKEHSWCQLIKRVWKSLIIPYLLLNVVSNIFLIPSWVLSKQWPVENLIYFLTADGRSESGPTWFLVCLAWVWLMSWLLSKWDRRIQYAILSLCAISTYFCPFHSDLRLGSALMVLPFFMLGYYLKGKIKLSHISGGGMFVLCLVATVGMTICNGNTNTYLREYGRFPLLYYPSAICGIFMLIGLCSMIGRLRWRLIQTLSSGTILIMALHGVTVLYIKSALKHLVGIGFGSYSLEQKMLLALVVLAALYYPIIAAQRYFPLLMGNRGKHGTKQ